VWAGLGLLRSAEPVAKYLLHSRLQGPQRSIEDWTTQFLPRVGPPRKDGEKSMCRSMVVRGLGARDWGFLLSFSFFDQKDINGI